MASESEAISVDASCCVFWLPKEKKERHTHGDSVLLSIVDWFSSSIAIALFALDRWMQLNEMLLANVRFVFISLRKLLSEKSSTEIYMKFNKLKCELKFAVSVLIFYVPKVLTPRVKHVQQRNSWHKGKHTSNKGENIFSLDNCFIEHFSCALWQTEDQTQKLHKIETEKKIREERVEVARSL